MTKLKSKWALSRNDLFLYESINNANARSTFMFVLYFGIPAAIAFALKQYSLGIASCVLFLFVFVMSIIESFKLKKKFNIKGFSW